VNTVLSILDRPGFGSNTDVVVVALPRRRALLWVPRDLLAVRFGCRINRVFARDGHDGLLAALRDLGIAAGRSVCVERELVETLLEPVRVEVPVPRPLEYWYPLAPQLPIEEGRRVVRPRSASRACGSTSGSVRGRAWGDGPATSSASDASRRSCARCSPPDSTPS
jgi:Fe2+ transport system protein FeoA